MYRTLAHEFTVARGFQNSHLDKVALSFTTDIQEGKEKNKVPSLLPASGIQLHLARRPGSLHKQRTCCQELLYFVLRAQYLLNSAGKIWVALQAVVFVNTSPEQGWQLKVL